MMMKKYWQDVNANPIGEFIVVGKGFGAGLEDVPRQIVGVVADVHDGALDREPMMYVPVTQQTDAMTARLNDVLPVTWVIRTRDAGPPRAEIERRLEEASGGIPVAGGRTMAEVVAVSSARAQFYMLLLSVFSVLSLMLVSVGLYGTMSYSVEQRTREIGVRMALGADSGHIRRLVVWQGLRLALLGIGVGIPAGLVLARLLVSLVYGLKPADPVVFGGVSVLVVAVAIGSAYFPSARAARVNPVESLRG
jgi:predicted lysophospholipase L1 biosynthesis ABC-type transport system permease subunit